MGEIDMMKESPEEKKILLKFKNNFDRTLFFDHMANEEDQKDAKIEADFRNEQKKEQEFQKALKEKRRKEKEAERAKIRRQKQIEDDARRHAAKVLADDMAHFKDEALVAATVTVEKNQKQKQLEEEEHQKMIEEFRQVEGKDMYDAQRALKEALLEQKEVVTSETRPSSSKSSSLS